MEPLAIVLIFITLVVGLVLGWFLGSRPAAQYRAERDARETDFKAAIADLAGAEARAAELPGLREELVSLRRERDTALLERVELKAKASAFEERLAEFVNARELMAGQFREVASTMLGEAQKNFLERADARFGQAGEQNEAKLKALLDPVKDTLKRYEEGLTRIEKEREGSYRALGEAVAQLTQNNAQVVRETQRLANVMRSSPKARGRWCEEQLKNILSHAGLAENVYFTLQTTLCYG